MTKDEVLRLALEALEGNCTNPVADPEQAAKEDIAITAIKEALAQPELTLDGLTPTEFALRELYEFQEATGCDTAAEFKAQPEQERNFCPRCGKRLGSNDWDVHTCTPPQPEQDIPKIGCVNHDCDKCKAQSEQEPVAWLYIEPNNPHLNIHCGDADVSQFPHDEWFPVYKSSPQRTWVGLTDEDIREVSYDFPPSITEWYDRDFARFTHAIEAKLKEKNT